MEESEGTAQQPHLPSWHAVPLNSKAGAEAALARAPQAPGAGLAAADTSTLQIEGGLCATGEAGGEGGPSRVHLWSVGGDGELTYLRALLGHQRGVSTLSFQRATGQLVAGCGGGAVKVWSLDR